MTLRPPGRAGLARTIIAWSGPALAARAAMAVQARPIADRYALGVADGRAGYASDRIARHRDACTDATPVPDERARLEGRRAGLVEYCQPHRAIDAGLAGRACAGVCRHRRCGSLYTAARRAHDARSRVASIERDLATKRRDIADRDTSDVRRGFLGREALSLEPERSRASGARADAEAALDRLRGDPGVRPVGAARSQRATRSRRPSATKIPPAARSSHAPAAGRRARRSPMPPAK